MGGDITTMTTEKALIPLRETHSADLSPSVVYQPHAFASGMEFAVATPGQTIAQIVDRLRLPEVYRPHLRVYVNDQVVPAEVWTRVRPRDGAMVYVSVVPHGGGGGGKNIFRALAFIAIAVLAVYTGGLAAMAYTGEATLAAALSTTAGTMVMAGVAMGVNLIGGMLVNALIPPPTPSFDINSSADASPVSAPRYQLTGASNRFSPYANIPRVFGKRRIYPLLAARPYTEVNGNEEYLRIALLCGWGPLRISDIKIGETPIDSYQDVEYEVREGWYGVSGHADDSPLTLFTNSVTETQFAVTTETDVWNTKTTDTGIIEISVDISFPAGLGYFNDSGGRDALSIEHLVQYRAVGTTTWIDPTWTNSGDDGFGTAGKITVSAADASTIKRSGRFSVAKGQYEVRVKRTTQDYGNRYVDVSQWTALRYVSDSSPILQKGVALIALRIKATGQLNGVPQTINCIAESYLPVYSGASWSYQVTRNPAWAYADILRRREGATFIDDSRIDLSTLLAWANACAATAPNASEPYWCFDGVVEGGSVWQTLKLIASHCRANYTIKDGKHSVVRDIAQTVPVQHITPRNSFGYSGNKTFIDLPHALRVKFVNADNGYQEDERIVYADGYNASNASRFESLDMPGCTSSTQAWREGRYQIAVGTLRPEEHQVSMDVEALRCTLGDYVMFSHDAISIGIASTRIKSLTTNVNGYVTSLTLEDEVYFDPGISRNYGLRVRRSDASSVLVSLVSNLTGYQQVVTPLTPIAPSSAPAVGDLVMFGEVNRESAPMLVKRIEPGPDLSVKLTLMDAQAGVWTADQTTIPSFNSYITSVRADLTYAEPAAPGIINIRSDESVILRFGDGTLEDRIYFEIVPGSGDVRAASYEVQFKRSDAVNWVSYGRVPADTPYAYLRGVEDAKTYNIRVRAISEQSIASLWSSTVTHTVVGKTTPPGEPLSFSATARVDGVMLSWTAPLDLDVVGYTIKVGADWATAAVVTSKFKGTSFFYGTSTASTQTFLIKSIDAIGLESNTPLIVSAAPSAPGDVVDFYAYARNDYVAASWTKVDGVGVEYEIRVGDSWSTGTVLGRTAGDKLETQYPIKTAGSVTYWIKAISSSGLYSVNAAFSSTQQAPIPNRNVVIERDWGALGYPGQRLDLNINVAALELAKINGRNAAVGDYYASLSLASTYYARAWTEVSSVSVSGSGVTWASATYSWASAGSATWQGVLGSSEAGLTSVYISRFINALQSTEVEGWRLNGSLTGVAGTTPSDQWDIGYQTCRFDQGLLMTGTTRTAWSVAIPSTFSVVFDFRADTFVDQDQVLVTLKTSGGVAYLRLVYDSVLDVFSLTDHVGNRINVSVPTESGDVVTFAISQSATSRSLYAATRRYDTPVVGTAIIAPIGNFTSLSLTA